MGCNFTQLVCLNLWAQKPSNDQRSDLSAQLNMNDDKFSPLNHHLFSDLKATLLQMLTDAQI